MRPRTGTRAMVMGLLLGPLPIACGTDAELPENGRLHEFPPSILRQAIPLEKAIDDQLLRAYPMDRNGSAHDMAIALKAIAGHRPWIRIDRGWRLVAPEGKSCSFVTYVTRIVRLPREGVRVERIPHVHLEFTDDPQIPDRCRLARAVHSDVLALFDKLDRPDGLPDWRVLQLAVWALVDNVSYAQVQAVTADGSDPRRGGLKASPDEVLATMQMLEGLEGPGFKRFDFNLWADAQLIADEAVQQYEELVFRDDPKSLDAFERVLAFYPLENAADAVIGAFDRHQGQGRAVFYRRRAFETLAVRRTAEELRVLQRAASAEIDEQLREEMLARLGADLAAPVGGR